MNHYHSTKCCVWGLVSLPECSKPMATKEEIVTRMPTILPVKLEEAVDCHTAMHTYTEYVRRCDTSHPNRIYNTSPTWYVLRHLGSERLAIDGGDNTYAICVPRFCKTRAFSHWVLELQPTAIGPMAHNVQYTWTLAYQPVTKDASGERLDEWQARLHTRDLHSRWCCNC